MFWYQIYPYRLMFISSSPFSCQLVQTHSREWGCGILPAVVNIVSADCGPDTELICNMHVSQLLEQTDHYFHVLDETTEDQRGILGPPLKTRSLPRWSYPYSWLQISSGRCYPIYISNLDLSSELEICFYSYMYDISTWMNHKHLRSNMSTTNLGVYSCPYPTPPIGEVGTPSKVLTSGNSASC